MSASGVLAVTLHLLQRNAGHGWWTQLELSEMPARTPGSTSAPWCPEHLSAERGPATRELSVAQ
jgi:hypothetical protein